VRDYIVRQSDGEGAPIIDMGESTFYIDDQDLVPSGYRLDMVDNTPKLKTIYVKKMEGN